MTPQSRRGVAITEPGYFLPAWALVRLLGDPASPLHGWRRELRSRDPELAAVLVGMTVAAADATNPRAVSVGGHHRAPSEDIAAYWITTAAAAERFGVTARTIRRMIQSGRLQARHINRIWLIDPNSIAPNSIDEQEPT